MGMNQILEISNSTHLRKQTFSGYESAEPSYMEAPKDQKYEE